MRRTFNGASNFNESDFHKQMVTFQSTSGKIYNDSSILKNSIGRAQRRSEFQKTKPDTAYQDNHQTSKSSHNNVSVTPKAP